MAIEVTERWYKIGKEGDNAVIPIGWVGAWFKDYYGKGERLFASRKIIDGKDYVNILSTASSHLLIRKDHSLTADAIGHLTPGEVRRYMETFAKTSVTPTPTPTPDSIPDSIPKPEPKKILPLVLLGVGAFVVLLGFLRTKK